MTTWRKKVQSNFEEMQARMTALHEGLQEVAVPQQVGHGSHSKAGSSGTGKTTAN